MAFLYAKIMRMRKKSRVSPTRYVSHKSSQQEPCTIEQEASDNKFVMATSINKRQIQQQKVSF